MSSALKPLEHVALNAVFLQPHMGGLETYVRQLVPALLEVRPSLRISIFLNARGRDVLAREPWADRVAFVCHPLLGRRFTRALSETTLLGWLASRSGAEVLHSVALTGPLRTGPVHVLTIGDVTWIREPDPADLLTTTLWRLAVPPVARRATRIIVYSEATRDEVVDDLRIPRHRIDVIPLGPGLPPNAEPTPESELRARLGLGSGPIVYALAAMRVHKNLARLVEAMPRVVEEFDAAVLVLPGKWTPHTMELRSLAGDLRVQDHVFFPGYVDESDVEGLYRAASCFAFPSRREGFGLPILEAMQRGVPVVCSQASAMPEVAGDAAIYFNPENPDEIASAICRILGDRQLADKLVAAGRERAKGFSWQRTAEETLSSYERARSTR